MNRLGKFIALPFRDQKLLAECVFLLSAIRISLWLFPFTWTNRLASRFELRESNVERLDPIAIDKIVYSVRVSSRFVPFATCLTQALATQILLRMRGQGSRVKFGVNKDENNGLIAHAWVEINDRIIIGEEHRHSRFSVLQPSDQVIL